MNRQKDSRNAAERWIEGRGYSHVVAMAMLTASKLVRALMFAISFINRSTKVVGLNDSDAAFAFLGLNPGERETARRLRQELEAELGLTPKTTKGVPAIPRG